MFNKIILIGNLTADPEVRHTPQGTPVCNLRVASNTKYKQGDQMREETLFISAVLFGKPGEAIAKYTSKGSPVLIEGRLRENSWEKDGQKKSRMEIIATTVRMLPKGQGRREDTTTDDDRAGDFAPDEITDIEPF
jgi:single-strand DNA-binding protein